MSDLMVGRNVLGNGKCEFRRNGTEGGYCLSRDLLPGIYATALRVKGRGQDAAR